MSHQRMADWRESNVRIRRLCADAFVTYVPTAALHQRWQAWEKMTIPLTLDENLLTQPGMTKETEAVVCASHTWGELLHMYGLIKSQQRAEDADKQRGLTPKTSWRTLFRDRALRGEESMPPPEPPEWKDYRAKMASQAKEGGERMREQIRATTRNWLKVQSIIPNIKERKLLGIGRRAHTLKGDV